MQKLNHKYEIDWETYTPNLATNYEFPPNEIPPQRPTEVNSPSIWKQILVNLGIVLAKINLTIDFPREKHF